MKRFPWHRPIKILRTLLVLLNLVACPSCGNGNFFLLGEFKKSSKLEPADSIDLGKSGVKAVEILSACSDFLILNPPFDPEYHLSFYYFRTKKISNKVKKDTEPDENLNAFFFQKTDARSILYYNKNKRNITEISPDSLDTPSRTNKLECLYLENKSVNPVKLIDMGKYVIGSGMMQKGRFFVWNKETLEISHQGAYPPHSRISAGYLRYIKDFCSQTNRL